MGEPKMPMPGKKPESASNQRKESPYSDKAELNGPEGDVKLEVGYDEKYGGFYIKFQDDSSENILSVGRDMAMAKNLFHTSVGNIVKLSLNARDAHKYAEQGLKNLNDEWN